jgi:SAM-dependent methyltransferase
VGRDDRVKRGEFARSERRSLTHVGGEVETQGDVGLADVLADALTVTSSTDTSDPDPTTGRARGEAEARAHVHGFHTYPARLHPTTARRLVTGLGQPGDTVLDPFCGSGTVAVEARLAGRRALGSDVNPLAVALARRKVEPASAEHRGALVACAEQVAEVARARRTARSGPSRRYPPPDVETFDPHVLLELDGLRVGLEALPPGRVRDDLYLVLSSILVKLSRKAADTIDGGRPTRIAAGFPTRHFLARTNEFVGQLAAIEPDLARGPSARIEHEDARLLRYVRDASVDLVVTSPPYAGVYDYLEHHRLRLRWLGLRADEFATHELGAKRQLAPLAPRAALHAFENQMEAMLAATSRVLRPGGLAAFVVADSAFGDLAVRIDELLAAVAPSHGLTPRAVASQARPHFHARTARAFARDPRREHVVVLASLGLPERGRETRSRPIPPRRRMR